MAVAGLSLHDIEVTMEENELTVREKQTEDGSRDSCTGESPADSSSAPSCWPTAWK